MRKKYLKPTVTAQSRPDGLIPAAVAGLSAAGAFAIGAAMGLGGRDNVASHYASLHLQPAQS